MVDGALGMGYGVTSTSFLVAAGSAPAVASASVHLAELGTTLASGVAHHRFGNVNWRAFRWMAVPGAVGGFLGATVLSNISAQAAKPWVAVALLVLGAYVLVRFRYGRGLDQVLTERPHRRRFFVLLGLSGGFLDAAGGGGWGPVSTPALLVAGRMEPRRIIGTVSASEFLVALGASAGFLLNISAGEIDFALVGALLAGGLVAAPLAAWLVHHVRARTLGTVVGGFIVFINARTLATVFDLRPGAVQVAALGFTAFWAYSVGKVVAAQRREAAAWAAEPVPA
ncbi:MAG: sulfite exporter TauE/SafE family protein [Actinobacteria bacterium]|nr:sulfite exporter TauE/SafE family protein [Actinomycetota bacterium]